MTQLKRWYLTSKVIKTKCKSCVSKAIWCLWTLSKETNRCNDDAPAKRFLFQWLSIIGALFNTWSARLIAACKHEWKRLILTHLADTVNRCRVRGRLKRPTEVAPTKLSKWKPRSVAFSWHREGGVSTFSTFPCARIALLRWPAASISPESYSGSWTWISSSF